MGSARLSLQKTQIVFGQESRFIWNSEAITSLQELNLPCQDYE